MRRTQEVGRRYVAGFVMVAGALYFAMTCVAAGMAWQVSDPWWLSSNFLALGLIPSFAAVGLARRAWSDAQANGAALCAIALVILLIAIVCWQLFAVTF